MELTKLSPKFFSRRLRIKTYSDYQLSYKLCKQMLIDARRQNDDETAKSLSQLKERIKRYFRRFCNCGHLKGHSAIVCPECRLRTVQGVGRNRKPIHA